MSARDVRGLVCRVSLGVLLVVATASSSARAQDTRPSGTPIAEAASSSPAPAPDASPVLAFLGRTELTGLVDTSYSYNLNAPKTACATVGGVAVFNCLHNFDVAHNGFSLNLAELALEKKPTNDSRAGFRVDLDYGSTAELVGGFEPSGTRAYSNIQQAYASFLAPTASGSLQVDVGKFVTPTGFEVIESKDNWNYSRSLLFALAIPYYHTGVRAAYSPNDRLTLTGFLLNGWNDVVDGNGGKSLGVAVAVKPTPALSVTGTYLGGPELADSNDWRHLVDAIVSYSATPKLALALNLDIGREKGSRWQGIATYARYQANDWLAVSPRYEYFSDRDGWATTVPQRLQELTLTLELKAKNNLLMRVEYRGDLSDRDFFVKEVTGLRRTQHVLTAGWMYSFSSRNP